MDGKLRVAESLFENSQEGITITDANGQIIDVNPAFTSITGYSRDEVVGKSPAILSSGYQDSEFYAEMWRSIHENGHWQGEIWNRSKSGRMYAEYLSISAIKDYEGRVSHYIGTFSDLTRLKERERELERITHYDPLTGLPNWRLFRARLDQEINQARLNGKIVAICILDIDGFKPINDSLGLSGGDRILMEIARRLSASIRNEDFVARLGGDEFALLLSGLDRVEESDVLLTRILDSVAAQTHTLNKQSFSISASIGATLFPSDEAEPDQMLRHADQAMYLAKQAGGNRYCLFDTKHDRLVREHRKLLDDLRTSLMEDRFELHYQPKVEMTTGRVLAVEALIRWRHQDRGLVLPGEFLPAVEGSDLEVPLGIWVVESGIRQTAKWKMQDVRLRVSINLSARLLQHPGFLDTLADILSRYPDIEGGDLEFEILESSALIDIEHAVSVIKGCQALGIRVALDDFGTGYASLSYFRQLPVNVLKIDQSFVRGMHDDHEDLAIVEGIIRISEAFNREVVAEGVECIEQGALLIHLGCRFAQGYAIARPMPAEEIPVWISTWAGESRWRALAQASPISRDDIPLITAESSHRRWVDGVMDYLEAAPAVSRPPPAGGLACAFGRWLREQQTARKYGQFEVFSRLKALHDDIHALVDSAVAQHQENPVSARSHVQKICELRDQIVHALHQLIETRLQGKTRTENGATYPDPGSALPSPSGG